MSGLDRIYAMGRYVPHPVDAEQDLLSYHIRGFKKYKNYAYPLGKGLEVVTREIYKELLECTIIVPVPLHPEKFAERGYNQSSELAKVVAEGLGIPVEDLLQKTRNVDMRALSWEERRGAVEGLYALQTNASEKIRGQRVLLVDDVVTTGFTMSECGTLLNDAGAASVNVLVAGRTV
jgi:ComF family protein